MKDAEGPQSMATPEKHEQVGRELFLRPQTTKLTVRVLPIQIGSGFDQLHEHCLVFQEGAGAGHTSPSSIVFSVEVVGMLSAAFGMLQQGVDHLDLVVVDGHS